MGCDMSQYLAPEIAKKNKKTMAVRHNDVNLLINAHCNVIWTL